MSLHLRQLDVRNRLLRVLSPYDFALLAPHLESVEVEFRQTLVAPNQPITQLYFPETGFVSIVTHGASDHRVEIGIIGREGLVGATPVLLGTDRTPNHAFVQNPGQMFAIPTPALNAAAGQSATLRRLLLRFIQVQIVHLGRSVHCNATYNMEVRLARWLLMCHDRVDGDEIAITHESLALMLGAQRSGATLAVQMLEGNLLIKARRGRITIVNRKSLLEVADGSYGIAEAEYARLIEDA